MHFLKKSYNYNTEKGNICSSVGTCIYCKLIKGKKRKTMSSGIFYFKEYMPHAVNTFKRHIRTVPPSCQACC